MHGIFKTLCLLFLVSYSSAVTGNSCRACSGTHVASFFKHVNMAQATEFFRSVVGKCATGNQYRINKTTASDCEKNCESFFKGVCVTKGDPSLCSTYTFAIDAYRYCGNGGAVNKHIEQSVTVAGITATRQNIVLSCSRSVQCGGDCDKSQCF